MKSINAAVPITRGCRTNISKSVHTGKYHKRTLLAAYFNNILTHIQLTNEACKVVVFEILGKDFACERSLIVNQESGSILYRKRKSKLAIIVVKAVDCTEK